jgi:DNA invertase Pin-like site-specific DNA recombinase
MRLVGYSRVSSLGQALAGVSVPEQERAMREWCASMAHELVAVLADNGITGRLPAEVRPALVDNLKLILEVEHPPRTRTCPTC